MRITLDHDKALKVEKGDMDFHFERNLWIRKIKKNAFFHFKNFYFGIYRFIIAEKKLNVSFLFRFSDMIG